MGKFAAIIFTVSLVLASIEGLDFHSYYSNPCNVSTDITLEYRDAMFDFTIETYKICAARYKFHTICSPISIWMVLSAIAEGLEPPFQEELLKVLHLPSDPCIRQKYYQLATPIQPDVRIRSKRILYVDDGIKINPNWVEYVTKNSLIDVVKAPIKSDPAAAVNQMEQAILAKLPKLDLSGNSVLVDVLDFGDIAATAFPDAVIERRPVYSATGEHIGSDDFITMKTIAEVGYVASLNSKTLKIPMGKNSRYQLLPLIPLINNTDLENGVQTAVGSSILEVLNSFRQSSIPIEVAIPNLNFSVETDVKLVFEELGVKSLWNSGEITRYISEPPLFLSSAVQRTHISLGTTRNRDFFSQDPEVVDAATGLDPRVGSDFIADRSVVLGLYDPETYSMLMAIAYSKPRYPL